MKDSIDPLPPELVDLREILSGKPAGKSAMNRLVDGNLVEEINGVALLTKEGIEAASRLRAEP